MIQGERLFERAACGLCGGEESAVLFKITRPPAAGLDIVKCARCGLVYLNRRPPQRDIGRYYPADTYYTCLDPPPPGIRKRLNRLAKESVGGFTISGGAIDRLVGKLFGSLLRSQVDFVVPYVDKGALLDVGCGSGDAFAYLIDQGWRVHGVDICAEACRHSSAQGLETFNGELADAGYSNAFFDVVILSHVLEHVYDPLAFLRECRRVLKNDGFLMVGVPNFDCFDRKTFGAEWYAIEAPRHLYHFTAETLSLMLAHAGFQVESWKPKSPFSVVDRVSPRYARRQAGGFADRLVVTWRSRFRSLVVKPIRYLTSPGGKQGFSVHLTAYARKDGEG